MLKLNADQIKAMEILVEKEDVCEIRSCYNNKVWKVDFYESFEKFRTYEEALIYAYMMVKPSADKVMLTQDDIIVGRMYDSILGALVDENTAFYQFEDGEDNPWAIWNPYNSEYIEDGKYSEYGKEYRGINNLEDFKENFEAYAGINVDWNKLETEGVIYIENTKLQNDWVCNQNEYWEQDKKGFNQLIIDKLIDLVEEEYTSKAIV